MPEIDRTRLPARARDLAARLGVRADDRNSLVTLTQTGRMKRQLGDPSWMSFDATQTLCTRFCAFEWRARFGPLGVLSVRDALQNGEGKLDVTALGVIPIARAGHTPELFRGELMRYLAEIAWAPDAILFNAALRWRDDGPDGLIVSAGSGEATAAVRLALDSLGRIAGAHASDRPRSVGAGAVPTPWTGQFSDYRLHDNRWIPFAGEVAWEIDGRPETYWQGRIRTWTID